MSNDSKSGVEEFRLPEHIQPVHYDIVIAPHLETGTFEGSSAIDIELFEQSSFVKLNAKAVSILQAHIESSDGTKLFGTVATDVSSEIATISFDGKLAAGKWTLYIRFTGEINTKLKGIYKSSWQDENGIDKALVATQFCATDARRAFPCFDEPQQKATFKISLIVDRTKTALSNSKTEFEEDIADGATVTHYHKPGLYSSFGPLYGKKRVQFKSTMKMSTYLVAFVIGDLVSKSATTVNGIKLRVWSTPGKEKLTEFALTAAAHGLAWFENYFKIKCPGDGKIDFIAVPDHAYGAMENLGCITFREPALLVDSKTASLAELKRVASTVIHEIAHMWFGDLVTMRWWNGVWLNEAFATFMQKLCTNDWKPEWGVFNDFSLSRSGAYDVDSLASTHAIESPVNHPDEASEMFDVISYQKGCSVLYQIHEYIGASVFRDGIIQYLKKHAFGSTQTHDLWDALEAACKAHDLQTPVREIMDAWVFSSGHPIVRVSESKISGCITLEQSLFSFQNQKRSLRLPVPVTLRVVRNSGKIVNRKVLLSDTSQTVYVGDDVNYVVVNNNGSGFYRVIYSDNLANSLLENGLDELSVVERFNLVNDSFDAVKAGIYTAPQYLSILDRFENEHDSRVWRIIASSISTLSEVVSHEASQGFKSFVSRLIEPTVRRLGWHVTAGESDEDLETRMFVLPLMVTVCGDDTTVKQARSIYEEWKLKERQIPAEILSAALKVLAYAGDKELYEEFSVIAFNGDTPQDRDRFLYSLAYFQSVELAEITLAKVKTNEVRMGDSPHLISLMMANSAVRDHTWQFIKANFDTMALEYPEPSVIKLIRTIANLNQSHLVSNVNQFFAKRQLKSATLAIAQSLEQMGCNVALLTNEQQNLDSLLV